ncbi:Tim44 domain-containing protein [Roseomonas sp. CCTCC AB2023176]|uniref:Tim44 domain-containing protein n=1 Tax=Roseomonas sp. CCTCC AB2023176 TaxID=3342640 RepID=UPI0035E0B7E3
MRTRARFLTFAAALALALGPAIAEARPGGGSSSGSRGSRTYSAPPSTNTAPQGGQRFDRTEAPRTPSTTGQPAPAQARPGMATPAPQPQRGGFMGGLMGGLAGGLLAAGLFGMFTGAGFFGGISGLAGVLGFLLQIALIAGLVYLVVRLIRGRRQPALAMAGAGPMGGSAMPNAYAREVQQPTGGPAYGAGGGAPATRPIQVGPTDFAAFERMLTEVNDAWTRRDVTALNRLGTPEMVRYFQGDMRDLDARGWRNETRDVRLEAGDLSEAWNEDGLDYATVAMRFSLVDVTYDATGKVVEGDAGARQTATELWTFVRPQGASWMLSAIQQTGR